MSKLIRVRMIGTGTDADPFRVPLPNTIRLWRDDETPFGVQNPRQAIAEIPDEDWLEPVSSTLQGSAL
jgi:hypothetical protein